MNTKPAKSRKERNSVKLEKQLLQKMNNLQVKIIQNPSHSPRFVVMNPLSRMGQSTSPQKAPKEYLAESLTLEEIKSLLLKKSTSVDLIEIFFMSMDFFSNEEDTLQWIHEEMTSSINEDRKRKKLSDLLCAWVNLCPELMEEEAHWKSIRQLVSIYDRPTAKWEHEIIETCLKKIESKHCEEVKELDKLKETFQEMILEIDTERREGMLFFSADKAGLSKNSA